jgi:hypothetical protein
MARKPAKRELVKALLDRHGRTYCEELRIPIESNLPSALFRWLCASILFSARIGSGLALRAAKALADNGLTSADRMAQASSAERTQILNRAGYARYDESTSRMLGDTADLLLREYRGDLRKLRERAGNDPTTERRLLKEFKGIGDVGADIFCREVQAVWNELYPFADKRALATSARLGLAGDARALSRLVPRQDFPRLVAALIRTRLAKEEQGVIEQASGANASSSSS